MRSNWNDEALDQLLVRLEERVRSGIAEAQAEHFDALKRYAMHSMAEVLGYWLHELRDCKGARDGR